MTQPNIVFKFHSPQKYLLLFSTSRTQAKNSHRKNQIYFASLVFPTPDVLPYLNNLVSTPSLFYYAKLLKTKGKEVEGDVVT